MVGRTLTSIEVKKFLQLFWVDSAIPVKNSPRMWKFTGNVNFEFCRGRDSPLRYSPSPLTSSSSWFSWWSKTPRMWSSSSWSSFFPMSSPRFWFRSEIHKEKLAKIVVGDYAYKEHWKSVIAEDKTHPPLLTGFLQQCSAQGNLMTQISKEGV